MANLFVLLKESADKEAKVEAVYESRSDLQLKLMSEGYETYGYVWRNETGEYARIIEAPFVPITYETISDEVLAERSLNAAEKYLVLKGFEVLYRHDKQRVLVAKEGEQVVMVFVEASTGLPGEPLDRARAERVAADVIKEHDELVGYRVRFDQVHLRILGEDRALLRHHVGVLSSWEPDDE